MFLLLPICTSPLWYSTSLIQRLPLMKRRFRPQLVLFHNSRTFWQRVTGDTTGCGVCWAVHLWNEQRCSSNQGSPTKPNLDPVIKQPALTTAPSKPRLPRRFPTMIILRFDSLKEENHKSELNVRSQQNLNWHYRVVYSVVTVCFNWEESAFLNV